MNIINFSFTPLVRDRCEVIRVALSRSLALLILRAVAAFVLIAFAIPFATAYVRDQTRIPFATLVLFVLIFVIAAVVLLVPWIVCLAVRLSTRFRQPLSPVKGDASDVGITLSTESGPVCFEWRTFGELVETRTHFLLAQQGRKRAFQMIPKRAFHAYDDFAAFHELIKVMQRMPGHSAAVANALRALLWVCVIATAIPTGVWLVYLLPPLIYAPR